MVIGIDRKFLFIHVPKCAGESITEVLLRPENGGKQFLGKHFTFRQAADVLGDAIGELHTFAVVRNPYEQVLSLYEHLRKPLFVPAEELERQYPGYSGKLHPLWACELAMQLDFPDYVLRAYHPSRANLRLFRDCCAWLVGSQDQIAVQRVLRFEHLDEGLADLAQHLGLSRDFPHCNRCHAQADPKRYRDRYDVASRRAVESWFRRTFAEFGYIF
jgi:hypothetical protein